MAKATRQLLEDTIFVESSEMQLDEKSGQDGKPLVFTCPFQRSDVKNANNRVYPRRIWERVTAEGGKDMKRVRSGGMSGFLGHPKDGVGLDHEGSHFIRDLKLKEDGTVVGTCEVLDTSHGKVVQEYWKKGVRFGISSRGEGSVDPQGIVQDDYTLKTFDIVLNPSTPGAFPSTKQVRSSTTETDESDTPDTRENEEPVSTTVTVESTSENRPPEPDRDGGTDGDTAKKETKSAMSATDQFKLLESEAEEVLSLTESDLGSKREKRNLRAQLLDLSVKASELAEEQPKVRAAASALSNKLADRRDEVGRWDVFVGHAAEHMDKKGETVDEAEELRTKLEEAEKKLAEAESDNAGLRELVEGMREDAVKSQAALTEAQKEMDEAYERLDAAMSLLAAYSAVFEENEVTESVDAVISQYPQLTDFKDLLNRCGTREELDETVEKFRAITGKKKPRLNEAELPGKGQKVKTPDGVGPEGETPEKSDDIFESKDKSSLGLFKTMQKRQRVLEGTRVGSPRRALQE